MGFPNRGGGGGGVPHLGKIPTFSRFFFLATSLRVDQVTVCQCVCVDTSRKTYPHMKLYHRQNRVDPLQSWRCTIPLLTDEQNDPSEIFWVERLVTTRRHLAREDQPLAEIDSSSTLRFTGVLLCYGQGSCWWEIQLLALNLRWWRVTLTPMIARNIGCYGSL